MLTLLEIFYYLIKTPASMCKLIEEIDNADIKGQLSHNVTWKEANKLIYLQACVKEALRQCRPCFYAQHGR